MRSRLMAAAIVGVLLLGACGFVEVLAASSGTVEASLAGLRGLSFREFLDASFKEIMIRDPEAVTKLGLSATFGMQNDALSDVSPEFILEDYVLCKGILDLLQEYDRAALSDTDQLSYDIYEWYLDDTVRGEPYALHGYPITWDSMGSMDGSVVALFTDYQPLVTEDDLADYVTRLSLVNAKMTQLVDALRYREERGIFPSPVTIDVATSRIREYLGVRTTRTVEASSVRTEGTIIWTSFFPRMIAMAGLSSEARGRAVTDVREAIQTSFIPGYVRLLHHLEAIRSAAPEVGGATSIPDWEAYYAYALRARTSLPLSAEEIHAIGLTEVDRIQTEMRARSEELGLATDLSMVQLLQAANADAPTRELFSTDEWEKACLEASQRAVDQASQGMERVCSLTPAAPLEIRAVSGDFRGFYFVPAAHDGSRPGVYYVNTGGIAYLSAVPAIAFHEGIPGHYFQITIAQGLDLPLFRRYMAPQAYTEGWASYSERLAADLGLYASPLEDLERLDGSARSALSCVVDTGIHSLGWSRQAADTYWATERGLPAEHQSLTTVLCLEFPGLLPTYTVGRLKFVELRERAEAALGAGFSLVEFHDLVLGNGPMPLEILERLVDEYIARKLAG